MFYEDTKYLISSKKKKYIYKKTEFRKKRNIFFFNT